MDMTIEEKEKQIVEEFSLFDDWMDKYNYLIEEGRNLPILDEQYRKDQYLITGCQSRVWLMAEQSDGCVFFRADSDALITKGIIHLLVRVLSGHTPSEIMEAKLGFIDEIGLKEHLSPTRSNGLVSMIKQIKLYALAIQTKNMSQMKG